MMMVDVISLQHAEIDTVKKLQTHRDLGTKSADFFFLILF